MIDSYNVSNYDRQNLTEYIKGELIANREKVVPLDGLTGTFFGLPENDFDYKGKYFFFRAKLIVVQAIRRIGRDNGVHIYSVLRHGKRGFAVVESDDDFMGMINSMSWSVERRKKHIEVLKTDMRDRAYKERVDKFFASKKKPRKNRIKVSREEFQKIANDKLRVRQ